MIQMLGLNSINKNTLNISCKQQQKMHLKIMSQTGLSTLVLVFIAYAPNMYINIEIFHKVNNYADNCGVAKTRFSLFIIIFKKYLLYFLKI